MEIDADEVRRLKRLIEATVEGMRHSSPRAMREAPFRRFGRQFNRIRDEAARLLPPTVLMPPRVPVGRKTDGGDGLIECRYVELRCYYGQLGVLLDFATD